MKNNAICFMTSLVFGFLILFLRYLDLDFGITTRSLFFSHFSPLYSCVTLLFFWGLIWAFLPGHLFWVTAGCLLGQYITQIPDLISPPAGSVGGSFFIFLQIMILGNSVMILLGNWVGRILKKLALRQPKQTITLTDPRCFSGEL